MWPALVGEIDHIGWLWSTVLEPWIGVDDLSVGKVHLDGSVAVGVAGVDEEMIRVPL